MKSLKVFLKKHNLEQTLVIGYYGGGNYGDELLLEVLATMLHEAEVEDVTITYQQPKNYRTFHRDFGYKLVRMSDKIGVLKSMRANQNIIVGGGGLWGLDMNLNIFFLSLMLFIARFFLKKNVFLLGVGYYDSTSWLGRISAFLAGKAATEIVARDKQTQANFERITPNVTLDDDLAWELPKLSANHYQDDLAELNKSIQITGKTLFITLRRFRPHQKNNYAQMIETFIMNNPERQVVVSLMEPKTVDPAGYQLIRSWRKKYKHVQITDFAYNPVALYLFFRMHRKNLAFMGPQFHVILVASLAGVPFLPLSYDNKVSQLLEQLEADKPIAIGALRIPHLRTFADQFYQQGEG